MKKFSVYMVVVLAAILLDVYCTMSTLVFLLPVTCYLMLVHMAGIPCTGLVLGTSVILALPVFLTPKLYKQIRATYFSTIGNLFATAKRLIAESEDSQSRH